MSKRGQVTVFIILGIIILALFGALLYFKGDLIGINIGDNTDDGFTSPDIEPVKDVVGECAQIVLLDGIEWVSNRGGYFSPVNATSASRTSNDILVAYAWHYDHGTRLPTLTALGEQINLYMSDHREEIEDCIDENIGSYLDSWNIENINEFILGPVQITEMFVKQELIYPGDQLLSIQKDDYAATASEIVVEIEIALGQAQEIAAEISSCFNGDYSGVDADYNVYCTPEEGVPFRGELYSMVNYRNVVNLLHQACSPGCDDCYHLQIPAPDREDIVFNVALRTCG